MIELELWQIISISLCFIWSGFVRSGIGFGGSIFALPLMLLVVDDPLFFLPAIAIHAIFFSLITSSKHLKNIDWVYLKKALKIIIIPKLIAVYGLVMLPSQWMNLLIFSIVLAYSFSYMLNRKIISNNNKINIVLLLFGGYVSGTSLIAGPLLVAVFANNVERGQLRNTLFALWFVLSAIKLIALGSFGVDFQLIFQLWWLPLAIFGHYLGLIVHNKLQKVDEKRFYQVLGFILFLVSLAGIWQNWS